MFNFLAKALQVAKTVLKKTFSKQNLQREARDKKKQLSKTNIKKELGKKKQQLSKSNIKSEIRSYKGNVKNVSNTLSPETVNINVTTDDIRSRSFREDKRLTTMQEKFFKENNSQASAFYSLTKEIWDDGITTPEQRNNKIVDFMITHNLAYTDEAGNKVFVSNIRDAYNLIKQLYPNEFDEAKATDALRKNLEENMPPGTDISEVMKEARGEVQISPIADDTLIKQLVERFAA